MSHRSDISTELANGLKHGKTTTEREVRRVVVRIDTTGLGPSHRVVEIGCVEMIGRKLTGRSFQCFVNPERKIDLGSMQVHGISYEFVADKPRFVEIATEFVNFVRGAELVVHNAEFHAVYLDYELGLLKLPLLERISTGTIDTLKMARKIRPGLKNSLDALCAEYSVDDSEGPFFDAIVDAERTAKIYLAMTRSQQEVSTMSLLERIEDCWAEVQKRGTWGTSGRKHWWAAKRN